MSTRMLILIVKLVQLAVTVILLAWAFSLLARAAPAPLPRKKAAERRQHIEGFRTLIYDGSECRAWLLPNGVYREWSEKHGHWHGEWKVVGPGVIEVMQAQVPSRPWLTWRAKVVHDHLILVEE